MKTPKPLSKAKTTDSGSQWSQVRRGDKMSERVARQIVNDIIVQDRRPGFMLPAESEMLREYQVSRGTLREALRFLEVQGLIAVKSGPGGGPMIAELDSVSFSRMLKFHLCVREATYREVLVARLAVEPMMARLAAEVQDAEGLAALRAAIERCERADPRDEKEWLETSHLFHVTIATMSGNTLLNLLGLSLKDIYRDWATSTITPLKMRSHVLAVHRGIADAIIAGDGDQADRLMRDHMIYFADRSGHLNADSVDDRVAWR